MKIAVVSDWFAEKMGYAENCLPKAMASLGHDVHLVTSDVQPYFDWPDYATTYEPFIGPGIVGCGVKRLDGYALHRLPHARFRGHLRIKGLVGELAKIRPHVVQTFDAFCWTTRECAVAKPILKYELFLESHMHASVFPPARRGMGTKQRLRWQLYAATVGRWVRSASERCCPISTDARRYRHPVLRPEEVQGDRLFARSGYRPFSPGPK